MHEHAFHSTYLQTMGRERITTYRHLILVDNPGDEQDVLYLLYLPADQGEDHYRHLILVDTPGDEQDVLYHCTVPTYRPGRGPL